MRVTLSLFRFGRPTCVYQHLCPRKWNPVLESHQPLRLCSPPPELIGQRDVFILRRPTLDRTRIAVRMDNRVDLRSPLSNRWCNRNVDECGHESTATHCWRQQTTPSLRQTTDSAGHSEIAGEWIARWAHDASPRPLFAPELFQAANQANSKIACGFAAHPPDETASRLASCECDGNPSCRSARSLPPKQRRR